MLKALGGQDANERDDRVEAASLMDRDRNVCAAGQVVMRTFVYEEGMPRLIVDGGRGGSGGEWYLRVLKEGVR
jgi:hypothetical protein